MPSDNLPPPDRSVYVQPKRRRNPLPAFFILFIISVLFFLARNWSTLSSNRDISVQNADVENSQSGEQASSQDGDKPTIVRLNADVTTEENGDDTILKVTNNDTYKWDHVIVDVNAMTSEGQHRGNSDNLAPGDSFTFKASQLGVKNGIVDTEVYTIKPDGTITGTWKGILSPKN